jgi:hypothetical protein
MILPVVFYGCETWSLTLREEHRLKMSENKILSRIFGHKTSGMVGGCRNLLNEQLHNLYSSPNDEVNEGEMVRACSTHKEEREMNECRVFDGKARRKEAAGNTQTTVGGPLAASQEGFSSVELFGQSVSFLVSDVAIFSSFENTIFFSRYNLLQKSSSRNHRNSRTLRVRQLRFLRFNLLQVFISLEDCSKNRRTPSLLRRSPC